MVSATHPEQMLWAPAQLELPFDEHGVLDSILGDYSSCLDVLEREPGCGTNLEQQVRTKKVVLNKCY